MARVSIVLLKLAPYVDGGASLILRTQEETEALKSRLERIQEGLKDAEMKGFTDQSVKRWLKDLEEITYHMDDALDKREMKIMELEKLLSLPDGIEKLINLRHLLNSDTFKLEEIPQGLEKLTSLWTPGEFSGSNLGCLRNLDQLQGNLFLSLKNFNKREASNANLCNKQHIQALELHFGEAEDVNEVVEELKPPLNLLALAVNTPSGKWLSHWLNTSFDNLKKVYFNGRGKCSVVLPFCQLPSLEKLVITACAFEHLSIEFLGLDDANSISSSSPSIHVVGGFPRLKKLHFKDGNKWEEWEDIKEELVSIMPLLKIIHCPALSALPHTLLGKATSL